jgi:hypothetical protein
MEGVTDAQHFCGVLMRRIGYREEWFLAKKPGIGKKGWGFSLKKPGCVEGCQHF